MSIIQTNNTEFKRLFELLTEEEGFKVRNVIDDREIELYKDKVEINLVDINENDFSKLKQKGEKYKEGYNILMEYWDSLPDEEKGDINRRLKGVGL